MGRPSDGSDRALRGGGVVSFIIPAFNEEHSLPATLDAIHRAAAGLAEPYEIVVADDASTDGTGAVARSRGARVVPVSYRQISATRNAGARAAAGDLLIFVDADTRVTREAVQGAVRAMRAGAAGGGCTVGFDGRLPLWARLVLAVATPLFRVAGLAAGAFLFCTRAAFDAAGGFDERLYVSEEIFMSRALGRQGRFVVLPHRVTTSGRKFRAYSGLEILGTFVRLALAGPRGLRTRRGLDFWYDRRGGSRPAHDAATIAPMADATNTPEAAAARAGGGGGAESTADARSAQGSGALHRWRRTLIPTTREAPSEAEMPSHVLLHRAGYIRRVGAGIYEYLPLGWRVLRKISRIVREEMDAAGAAEMLMPAMEPIEFFKETKRDVDYGDTLFKVTDRHGRVAALAPTHEEIITDLLKGAVTSYKQLPLNLYQIQTKYRDEFRPRSALLRAREFIMKDAYSFHLEVEGPGGLNETYDAMHRAYVNIFTRCGLDFSVVEAESGPIGGAASHEFMVNCESGEDTILRCPKSGYAANVEKCEIGERPWSFDGGQSAADAPALEKVHTPGMPGIDAVAGFLGVSPPQMLKTIVFKVVSGPEDAPEWVLAVVRGDHDVNEGKVKSECGCTVTLAGDKEAREAGFAIGYVSPRMILEPKFRGAGGLCKILLLVDPDAAQGRTAWATGSDEADHHVRNFFWHREMGDVLDDPARVRVADVRNALMGDPSPRAAGATLEEGRGIEVGHIFKLGTKYSDAMGLTVLDKEQQRRSVIMGCYGLGVSRTMAACVEMSHDGDGIIWPAPIAPYHVLIVVMKPDNAEHASRAQEIAASLADAGLDVLIDDREERPGVKFKDADLIGVPIRLTIGERALAQGAVEFKLRRYGGKGEQVPVDQAVDACLRAVGA